MSVVVTGSKVGQTAGTRREKRIGRNFLTSDDNLVNVQQSLPSPLGGVGDEHDWALSITALLRNEVRICHRSVCIVINQPSSPR